MHFHCPFCAKHITFNLKKYRRVIFHDTKESSKNWWKTDLWFGKWHQEFGKLLSKHTKVSKLELLLVPFIQNRKCMSLKLTGKLCVEWCRIWTGIDSPVQNWHKEFNKFWPEHSEISKICTLMGCFWPKCIMFELIKYRGVMFDCT